jgi:surfactin synthase thioesterase subunit
MADTGKPGFGRATTLNPLQDATGRLRIPLPRPRAELRLVCFPHAGGGASAFRRWARLVPPSIEVAAAEYPGRPGPDATLPVTDFGDLADRLAEAIAGHAPTPVAFFGHSMGATVAFEVARRLPPTHLFASARRAPSETAPERLEFPDDEELLDFVRILGGSGAVAARYPEMRAELLPVLRRDLELLRTYRYRPGPPLPCPITVLRGAEDPMLDAGGARRWSRHTESVFASRTVPGGHFFIEDRRAEVVALLVAELDGCLSAGPSSPSSSR